ncbi:protease complex subunit PrcB family protein [Mesonia sp. HuA40]|uniref:protease complex subunit PrcB family protein n=1 Tax=Mesonia sp. HuA40 TaxID=2602761 RepID=UPI0011CA1E9E|nr:protease complex subunit PrcB family protein [Mesonia sp. HuA40]TXK72495.1 protease complex subunit PrcB family protein [Mesonia sp. HuA40]
MKAALGIFILAFSLISCNTMQRTHITQDSLALVGAGNLYGNGEENLEPNTTVIRQSSEWEQIKRKMDAINATTSSFKGLPVNFENEMVLAIISDIKTTGGYAIDVLGVEEKDEEIIINYTMHRPEGVASTVMTQPYYVAKLPKRDKPVRFVKQK